MIADGGTRHEISRVREVRKHSPGRAVAPAGASHSAETRHPAFNILLMVHGYQTGRPEAMEDRGSAASGCAAHMAHKTSSPSQPLHRTCAISAALAVIAALFGAGRVEMVAQRIEQCRRRNLELRLGAVDVLRHRDRPPGWFFQPAGPLRSFAPFALSPATCDRA
jgi:hypothetical protein